MSREWKSDTDKRWVMRCDVDGCPTSSEPSAQQPDLQPFADAGWSIARVYGDRCPKCVACLGRLRPGENASAAHPRYVSGEGA